MNLRLNRLVFRIAALALGSGLAIFINHQRSSPLGLSSGASLGDSDHFKPVANADREGGSLRSPATPASAAAGSAAQLEFSRFMERLAGASPEEFPRLWEELSDNKGPGGHMRFGTIAYRHLLLQEWVRRDAQGALQFSLQPGEEKNSLTQSMLESWLGTDPAAALAHIAATDWESLEIGEVSILNALASHDARLALERMKGSSFSSTEIGLVLQRLAGQDIDAAIEFTTKAHEGKRGHPDYSQLVRGCPPDQLHKLIPVLEAAEDWQALSRIGSRLAQFGTGGDIGWIRSLEAGRIRSEVLGGFFHYARLDSDTFALLESIPSEELSGLRGLGSLLQKGTIDGGETWDRILELRAETREFLLSESPLETFSYPWALDDPQAAFAAIADISEGGGREGAHFAAGVARALGQRDPLSGIAMAASLPIELQEDFLHHVGANWADVDPSGYHRYLEASPDSPQLLTLKKAGFGAIAHDSPEAAVPLLGLFEGDEFAYRAQDLAKHWALRDAKAATEWIGGMPEGKAHDVAAVGLGDTLRGHDPAGAAQAYLLIDDQEDRERQLFRFIDSLAKENPAAAGELVRTTEMDAESRAFLEAVIEDE